MIKVMLVDDHELVRIGLRSLLSSEPDIQVLGDVSSGEDALQQVRLHRPDVILMDIKMPGIGGLAATTQILGEHPEAKIIALTSCDEDPFPSRLLQAGASGYLTKGCDFKEMLHAIHKVYQGSRYISPTIAQQLAIKQATVRGNAASPFDALSKREMEVMMLITSGQKVQVIAEKLALSAKTINTYRYRIFEKLKVDSDVELTHLALRYGIVNEESLPESENGTRS